MPKFASSLFLTMLLGISAPAVDTTLLNTVMPDARVVAGVNARQIKASDFGKFLLSQAEGEDRKFQEFILETGLDPRRDIDEILVSSKDGKHGSGILAVRGLFNTQQILSAVARKGGIATKYNDADLISRKADSKSVVAVVNGTFAIAGEAGEVRAALDRRAAAMPAVDAATVQKLDGLSARYDAWVFVRSPADLAQGHARRDGGSRLNAQSLEAVEEISSGIEFGPSVRISGEAIARSDKDATALADVLRFVAGLVQLQSDNPSPQVLADLLNSLEIKTEANRLTFSMAVPETQLEEMIRNHRTAPVRPHRPNRPNRPARPA